MLRRVLHLRALMRDQYLPPARLEAMQAKKLGALLRHAVAKVPFYRERFSGLEVPAGGVTPSFLRKLPLVDKAALRAAGSDAWDGPATPDDHWIQTSGSSGEPFRFPITRAWDQRRKAQYLRPYLSNGRGMRDPVVRLTASPRPMPWFAKLGLLPELQLACDTAPDEVLAAMRTHGARVLQGYPSALRLLAQHVRAQGITPPPVHRLFTDSEMLTPSTRRLVEGTFGAPLLDVYGSFETDNIAWQCEAGRGHHVTTDTVILELLRDGEPVADGEEGEIVVTVLENFRSPFIRYRLRDMARRLPGPCACGRGFPLIEITRGRADDLLRLPDGSERSIQRVLGALDGLAAALVHHQLRQRADGTCELVYVPAPDAGEGLAATLRDTVGPLLGGQPLVLTAVESIPLTAAGKLRAFVQEG